MNITKKKRLAEDIKVFEDVREKIGDIDSWGIGEMRGSNGCLCLLGAMAVTQGMHPSEGYAVQGEHGRRVAMLAGFIHPGWERLRDADNVVYSFNDSGNDSTSWETGRSPRLNFNDLHVGKSASELERRWKELHHPKVLATLDGFIAKLREEQA